MMTLCKVRLIERDIAKWLLHLTTEYLHYYALYLYLEMYIVYNVT